MVTEQEYGASTEMIDDGPDPTEEVDVGPGPYPAQAFEQQQHAFSSPPNGIPMTMPNDSMSRPDAQAGFGHMFDPADPMLDADPFGLTASMHFPTPFSFQESSMRR